MAVYYPPSARLTNWEPGVYSGVQGGIERFFDGSGHADERTTALFQNMVTLGADNTGVVDCASILATAFVNARHAATAAKGVYFPAGTYKVSSFNSIASYLYGNDRITIRGAGKTATILNMYGTGAAAFQVGSGSSFNYPVSGNTITAGLTKGSSVITIADTSAFSVGNIVQIEFENVDGTAEITAGATPVLSVNYFPWMRRQVFHVVSKTSSTLTLDHGIHHTPVAGKAARVTQSIWTTYGFGIESMTIDGQNSTATCVVKFDDCFNCYMYDVRVRAASNYHLQLTKNVRFQLQKCDLLDRKTGGTNGSGLLLQTCSNGLHVDNVIKKVFPAIEVNHGSCGNVFAYNIADGLIYDGGGGIIGFTGFNTNHGPHNSHNLYEGNIIPYIQCDGYFGGGSDDTFFRNWLSEYNYQDSARNSFVVSLNRFTRNYSLVNNIISSPGTSLGANPYSFGNPNLGNSSYDEVKQMSAGNFPTDWGMTATLTTRTDDTTGVMTLISGTARYHGPSSSPPGQFRMYVRAPIDGELIINGVGSIGGIATGVAGSAVHFSVVGGVLPAVSTVLTIAPGIQGYQFLDPDVEATTILKGNRHNWTAGGNGIPAGQSMGGDTHPDSYCYTAQPSWWPTSLAWPPFDASLALTTAQSDYERLPAAYRFINGSDAPTGTPSAPVITLDPVTQTATEGDDVTLSANASGNPTPTWQWKKNGSNISGATTRFLVLLDVVEADEASYTAVATNTEGTDTSAAGVLTVNPAGGGGLPTSNPIRSARFPQRALVRAL